MCFACGAGGSPVSRCVVCGFCCTRMSDVRVICGAWEVFVLCWEWLMNQVLGEFTNSS